MRVFFLLPVLLLFVVSCSDKIVEPKVFGEGDDYLIYESVLKDRIVKEKIVENNFLIVLDDSTRSQRFDSNSVKYFCENIPGMNAETMHNYISVNSQKINLDRILGIDFVFLSEFNSDQRHVDVVLSKVGYYILKTQAVVTIGLIYGPLAGNGYLIYLEKIDGEWKIQKTIMTWIS